jgi:hypothetical protein
MRVSAALPGFLEDLREAVDTDNVATTNLVGMTTQPAHPLAHKETA